MQNFPAFLTEIDWNALYRIHWSILIIIDSIYNDEVNVIIVALPKRYVTLTHAVLLWIFYFFHCEYTPLTVNASEPNAIRY